MELNVTKMTFKGVRIGYAGKRILSKQKAAEMQGNQTTPASINLFKKIIQKHTTK